MNMNLNNSNNLRNLVGGVSVGGQNGSSGSGGVGPAEGQQVSSLPLPPTTYITQYSEENVRRGRAPKPPPPPPSQDSYSMFGAPFHADDAIIRPLESQGIRRLYPQNFDHRRELKKLNHSVLVNFLDLLEILIKCPESGKRQEKIDDITLLFIHIHHLINEFRPHQARETLRVMMEMQKRSTLDVCDRFQKHLEKSVDIIRSALTALPNQQNLHDDPTMTMMMEMDDQVRSMTEEADSLLNSLNTIKASLQLSTPTTSASTVSENKSTIPAQDLDTMMCAIVDSL